jgi:hypothetical protein
MNRATPALLLAALTAAATVMAGEPSARPVPQPRLRLDPSAQRSAAKAGKPAGAADVVSLDPMVVAASRLAAEVPRREAPEPKRFSLADGGPAASGTIGGHPFEVGLWAWRDLFAEDAQFKPAQTRVEFSVLRIKL